MPVLGRLLAESDNCFRKTSVPIALFPHTQPQVPSPICGGLFWFSPPLVRMMGCLINPHLDFATSRTRQVFLPSFYKLSDGEIQRFLLIAIGDSRLKLLVKPTLHLLRILFLRALRDGSLANLPRWR